MSAREVRIQYSYVAQVTENFKTIVPEPVPETPAPTEALTEAPVVETTEQTVQEPAQTESVMSIKQRRGVWGNRRVPPVESFHSFTKAVGGLKDKIEELSLKFQKVSSALDKPETILEEKLDSLDDKELKNLEEKLHNFLKNK
jgi:hypothetical protein